ncbi:MAG: PAS domain-containing protein [Sulfuricurvum sp.]
MTEKFLSERMLIISETDEHGIITFANEDFVSMSGYGYHELVGQPHNILRHPVMPAAAFADLWATIKSDKIWNGFVCNRCKNGDYYWVYATVSAIKTSNGARHYLSVRRRPTQKEVEHYSAMYKTMKA